MTRTIQFTTTPEEFELVGVIANRYRALVVRYGTPAPDTMELYMDLSAVHANGNPIDFARLAEADDLTLIHDVGGIRRHIDRKTGELRDCFTPRCSQRDIADGGIHRVV